MKDDREKVHSELIEQLSSSEIDKDEVMKVYESRKAEFDKRIPVIIDKLAVFHKSLNDEQRKEIVEKIVRMKKWHN